MVGLVHFSVSVERDFTIAFDDEFFPLISHQQKVTPEWPFPIQTDIKTCDLFVIIENPLIQPNIYECAFYLR